MMGLTFSSKLDWGSCIISIAKTTTKKIGALIHSMKFLSAEVAHVTMHEILLSCLGWCSYVVLGIFRQATKTYIGLLVLYLLPLLHPWLIVEMQPASVFSRGITLVDVYLKWLSWFHFLIISGGLSIILMDYLILLSSFLDVIGMSMSTVPFLAQLYSGIFCLQNAFP